MRAVNGKLIIQLEWPNVAQQTTNLVVKSNSLPAGPLDHLHVRYTV